MPADSTWRHRKRNWPRSKGQLAAVADPAGSAERSAGGAGRTLLPGEAGRVYRSTSPIWQLPAAIAAEPAVRRWWRSAPTCARPRRTCMRASAQVGVAIANRLPNISLTANAGQHRAGDQSTVQIQVRVSGAWARIWPTPIFQGGSLRHQERAARAGLCRGKREQYRSTVLTAFQNVADTLAALRARCGRTAGRLPPLRDAAKLTLDRRRQSVQGRLCRATCRLLGAEQGYQQARIRPGAGAGQSLRRHRGAVPGAGWRLVACRGQWAGWCRAGAAAPLRFGSRQDKPGQR